MRCIETIPACLCPLPSYSINYNMRCIETMVQARLLMVGQDKLQHEMYWNLITFPTALESTLDKLQHEMYWNSNNLSFMLLISSDKLQHEMYWNSATLNYVNTRFSINYNMRCIETTIHIFVSIIFFMINYNMRCIETVRARQGSCCHGDKLQHEMYWNCLGSWG